LFAKGYSENHINKLKPRKLRDEKRWVKKRKEGALRLHYVLFINEIVRTLLIILSL